MWERPDAAVLVDLPVGQGNGHAPCEGNNNNCHEADQGDKDEEHQEHVQCCDKVILVQHPELGHVEPVVAEFFAVTILSIYSREAKSG